MGIVKDILKKRTENRARLEKEAPNLYNGFNELMKHYYKRGWTENIKNSWLSPRLWRPAACPAWPTMLTMRWLRVRPGQK